jgi:dipeptidyl-peptidase-4
MEVAKQDISKLVAYGWVPPIPITVKAATARPTSTA